MGISLLIGHKDFEKKGRKKREERLYLIAWWGDGALLYNNKSIVNRGFVPGIFFKSASLLLVPAKKCQIHK